MGPQRHVAVFPWAGWRTEHPHREQLLTGVDSPASLVTQASQPLGIVWAPTGPQKALGGGTWAGDRVTRDGNEESGGSGAGGGREAIGRGVPGRGSWALPRSVTVDPIEIHRVR